MQFILYNMKHAISFTILIFLSAYYNCLAAEDCPSVTLKNGRARKKHIFIQFNCNRGYILYGSKFSKCTDGNWESIPVCVRNRCTAVREILNGDLLPFNRGATIQFWCKSGYTLKGSSVIYCDGKQWNDTTPFCNAHGKKPPLSCDFETNNLCGWIQDVNHDFDWTKYNINLTTWHVKSGPEYDHTKGPGGNGYYMFIDASSSTAAEVARLISPIYDKFTTNVCLEFFYHMRHHGNGILNVHIKYTNSSWDLNNNTLLFTRTGYQGNKWNRAYVNVGVTQHDFQIVFEGIRGDAVECDIAIDDVKIIENCTYVPEEVESTTEYITIETTSEELGTCYNRCNSNDTSICSCNENCFLHAACCLDYVYYCLQDQVTEAVSSEEIDTSETELDTTINESTTKALVATTSRKLTTPKKIAPVTTKVPVTTTRKLIPVITRKSVPITTRNPIATTKGVLYPITSPTKLIPTTTRFTTVVLPTKPKNVDSIKPITVQPVVITKLKDHTETIFKFRKPTQAQTTATRFSILKDKSTTNAKMRMIKFNNDAISMKETNKESSVITKVLPAKVVESQQSNVLLISSISILTGVISIALIIVVYKKCKLRDYVAGRKIKTRNRTSESDIRFLTSDEVLDFRLALLQDEPTDNF